MIKNRGFSSIIILVIVIIVMVGYLIYKLVFGEPTIDAWPTLAPTASSQAMVDTTGWETYTAEGYSLMYPSTFTASDTEENGAKGISLLMHGQVQKDSGRTQTELFDGVIVKSLLNKNVSQTLEEYANSEYQTAKSSLDPNSDDYFTDLVKTTVAGQDAYVYDIHGYSDAKIYYMSVGENVLKIIVIYAGSDTDVPGYLSQANQILSTFKFTQ